MILDNLNEHWLIAASSRNLSSKPLACEILNTPIVIFRDKSGVGALLDRCPHRNVPLSHGRIIENAIECPYHGWQFDKDGECQKIPGSCNRTPAHQHAVIAFEALEAHGFIWVKLKKSLHEIDKPPRIDDMDYHSFVWETEANGAFVNVLENFLDGTHTHFVHEGLIRKEGNRQKVTATIKRGHDRVEIKYEGEGKQSGIISKWFERSRKESYGRFILPSIAEIEYCSDRGVELLIRAYMTPATVHNHKIYAIISLRKGIIPGKVKQWVLLPFFKKALRQDLEILQLQHDLIERFGQERFISTELDLIRPHIQSLLKGNTRGKEKSISVLL